MNYSLNLLIYFFVGVLQDFLLTLNFRFVAKEKIIPAAVFSFLTVVISMLVLYNILTDLEGQRSIIAILIYSLGIGVGTIVAMKTKIGS